MKSPFFRRGRRFVTLLATVAVLGIGCSTGEKSFVFTDIPPGQTSAPLTARGVLARSSSGAIALLDSPLPPGFVPLPDTQVTVVGSAQKFRSDATGALTIPTNAGRIRLLVESAGASTVLEAPAFSGQAGQPVSLRHFPPSLHLSVGERAAVRTVGVDGQGVHLPVQASQSVEPLDSTVATTPATSHLAQSVSLDSAAGYQLIESRLGGIEQTADLSTFAPACQAVLSGRVTRNGQPLEGALVQVEGTFSSVRTDSDGRYRLENLPPLPSAVHVYLDGQQVAVGLAPLASRLLTELDLVTRPVGYQGGTVLPIRGASGVATRFNRSVYVSQGANLAQFTATGSAVPITPAGPDLQAAGRVATDFSGEAYVVDRAGGAIVPIGAQAQPLPLPGAAAVTTDAQANILALSDTTPGLFFFANQTASRWSQAVVLASEHLGQAVDLAAGADGRVYVADRGNSRVAVFELTQKGRTLHADPNGSANLEARLVSEWPVSGPLGIALGPNGEVYVSSDTGVVCTDNRGYDPIAVSSVPALGPLAVDREGVVWVAEASGVQSYQPTSAAVSAVMPPEPTGQSLVQGAELSTMETALLREMQQYGFTGATLAISVNGRLILSRGYGYARRDGQAQVPSDPSMRFRLASCSKVFTAAAALLQLQDYPGSVSPHLKPFEDNGLLAGGVPGYDLSASGFADQRQREITILSLLQMTAGLDNPSALYSPLARTLGGSTPPASAIEILLHTYANDRLTRAPGNEFVYSDVAYMTLGRLVEAVARSQGLQDDYAAYVQNRLLIPLGITTMRIADTRLEGAAPNEVSYYPYSGEPCGQSVFTNAPEQVPATYGGIYDGRSHDSTGGWIATVTDLVTIANALAPGQTPAGYTNPLDAVRRDLFKALPAFAGAQRSYYYSAGGWFMTADEHNEITLMNKDGSLPGTTAFVQYEHQGPDRVVFAYLLNGRGGTSKKRVASARQMFQLPITTFIASQAGNWPQGDLRP